MDGFVTNSSNFGGFTATKARIEGATGVTGRIATDRDMLRVAGAIRHEAYSSQNFIEPTSDGIFLDECDLYPSSNVVIAFRDGVPVGTARVCLYAPDSKIPGTTSIPVMEVFGPEISQMLSATRAVNGFHRAVEVMRLATIPAIGFDTEIVFALYLMAGYITLHYQANAVICAVRRHHIPFYKRFGLHKAAEPRSYPKLKFQTGLVANVQSDCADLKMSMPILHPISLNDSIYPPFMAGDMVPVFEGIRSPESVVRLLSSQRNTKGARTDDRRDLDRTDLSALKTEIAA
jgi:hypothetical protein